jgi:hypothetical protein
MGCVATPQTREPTVAPPNPTMARALHGTIGSGGAMSWWRRWPTHGGRGPKPLEGRVAAAHVGCCVLWLCGCVVVLCSRTFYPFCRAEHPTHADISPLFNARTNAKLCSPQAALTNQHAIRVCQCTSKLGWQLGMAFILRGENMHFLCTSVRYSGRIGT